MNTISHKIGAHRSPNLAQLIAETGWEGYGLYIAICDTLAEQDDGKYPVARIGALAFSLHADEGKIKGVICDYGLFVMEKPPQDPNRPTLFPAEEVFYAPEIIECLEKAKTLSDKRSKAAATRWKDLDDMQTDASAMQMECKSNASAMHVESKCNTNALQKEKEISPRDKEKEKSPPYNPPIREKEITTPLEKKKNAYQRDEKFSFGEISRSTRARAREVGIPLPDIPNENDLDEAIKTLEQRLQENLPADQHNETIDLKELIFKEKEKICAQKEKEIPPPPIQKFQPLPGTSLLHQLRLMFEQAYKEQVKLDYYWTAKDATALKQIIAKINFQIQGRGLESSDTLVKDSWALVLQGIQDPWIRKNLSPAIINSKWNEILQQIHATPSTYGRDNKITDDYRRDVARRLAL